jgi:cytochrome c oxidase subunit 2
MKPKHMVFVALIAFMVFMGCTQQSSPTSKTPQQTTTQTKGTGSDNTSLAPVKEINVIAKRFSFTPNPIKVKLGERVRLNITSQDVTHGFALPEFGINEIIPAGQTITIEFTANKKGTFAFNCSVVCGAGHSIMKGVLIVE